MAQSPGAPANTGRDPAGRFTKGSRHNPGGKPKGARHRATQAVEALLFGNVEAIARTLVKAGKAGEAWAVKAALVGMLPTRSKRIDQPLDLKAPSSSQEAVAQIAWLVSAVARGEVDIDAGQALIQGLQSYVGGCAIGEIERKAVEGLAAIERLKAELADMVAKARMG
jgi:hypothetical protein